MPIIHFEATPFKIGARTILKLPKSASMKLPSRGQTMVKGTINGCQFQAALEPDGDGSHWFEIDARMRSLAKTAAGDIAVMAIELHSFPTRRSSDLRKSVV